jgi:hypothetical protein
MANREPQKVEVKGGNVSFFADCSNSIQVEVDVQPFVNIADNQI